MQEVDIPLTTAAITDFLVGREVYRRTEYLILRHGNDAALVHVAKDSLEPLFSPASGVRVLAEPDGVAWVHSPQTDTGNATALARAALAGGPPGLDAYVVQGLFEHVNFIWRPAPVPIRVTEVIPPSPPKLVEQTEQAVAFDEDLPPIEVIPDLVDLETLLAGIDAGGRRYLLPCRGSGVEADQPIDFLDTRPLDAGPWVMVGCERSAQFYRHFYDREPERIDLCPKRRPVNSGANGTGPSPGLSVVKCCLLERGVEFDEAAGVATVPWGANLDEVRLALRLLTGVGDPATPLPYSPEDSPASTARISSP